MANMEKRGAFRFVCCILSLVLVSSATMGSKPAQVQSKTELRVLFVGNSLTYANDMPAIVEALAELQKRRLVHKSVAFPNYSLQDHWERGDARRAIAAEHWDVVILQQGPSALEESRQSLLEYTRRFAKEIRAAGATPALYMVWPSEARMRDFDRLEESYRLAAAEVRGILLPAGAAWREAWKRDPKLDLYAADRFHPSLAGSYLAALVTYQKLFGVTPIGLPTRLNLRSKTPTEINLPKKDARVLQLAASETNKRF